MDIKKPQLVKVEAFAVFLVRHTGPHSGRKIIQNRSSATSPPKALRHNMFTVRNLRHAKGTLLLFAGDVCSEIS